MTVLDCLQAKSHYNVLVEIHLSQGTRGLELWSSGAMFFSELHELSHHRGDNAEREIVRATQECGAREVENELEP